MIGPGLRRISVAAALLATMVIIVVVRLQPSRVTHEDSALAEQRRSESTFIGDDGQEHVYLGDLDSYLWLRHARNLLNTGSPCDEIRAGECRDTFTNAPVRATSLYAKSLHPAAIAGLQRVVAHWHPGYPLSSTSFLIPVIVSALAVLPVFFVTRRLAGTAIGAPIAAVIATLHPVVLNRTQGSDNDIWSLALPLYGLWALTLALAATTWPRRAAAVAAAAVAMALQVWAWRGWPFAAAILVAGLLCACATAGMARLRGKGDALTRVAAIALGFYFGAGALGTLLTSEAGFFSLPWQLFGAIAGDGTPSANLPFVWPSAFGLVGELVTLTFGQAAQRVGVSSLMACGLVGLLLVWLPPRAVTDREPPLVRPFAAAALTLWCIGGFYLATTGLRYLLLVIPPLAIGFGVCAGRFALFVAQQAEAVGGRLRLAIRAVLVLVLVLAFLNPLVRGIYSASAYTPMLNDAWWDTLVHLRDTTSRDAIAHVWWDYGHWVKYVAERRVSADGTSLGTHIPFWLAKALASPSENESAGVLRMLSCGSDASPLPEGSQGAFSRLVAAGKSDADAYAVLTTILTQTRDEAGRTLAGNGISDLARVAILDATHCTAPPQYLLLSDQLTTRRSAWMSLGLSAPKLSTSNPRGVDEDVEQTLPFLPTWFPCSPGPEGQMVCAIRVTYARGGAFLQRFEYVEGREGEGTLRYREGEAPESLIAPPGAIVVAGREEGGGAPASARPESPVARVGVLVDATNRRILVGAPAFVRSTYVQLVYLDGVGLRRFHKDDERRSLNERVTTWRIEPR